jgi:hypothetical protein
MPFVLVTGHNVADFSEVVGAFAGWHGDEETTDGLPQLILGPRRDVAQQRI